MIAFYCIYFFEIAKYFRKHGSKIVEYSSQGTLTLENKKGKFLIEEINVKKRIVYAYGFLGALIIINIYV